jgi:hypothetical protein
VVQSRRRIDEELSRIAKRHSAIKRARASEKKSSVRSTLSRRCDENNQQQVGLRELESEVEFDRRSRRVPNRAKEVGEQQDLNDTTRACRTRAVPPTASSPPRTLIIAGSFILGLIGGGDRIAREQFNSTVISARELATDFRMRVLAELSDYADAPSPVFDHLRRRRCTACWVSWSRSSDKPRRDPLRFARQSDVRSIIALNLRFALAKRARTCSGDQRFPSARCDAAGCYRDAGIADTNLPIVSCRRLGAGPNPAALPAQVTIGKCWSGYAM